MDINELRQAALVPESPASFNDELERRDESLLDPRNSERQYYRDPTSGIRREIWRPGDGDGVWADDYYQKPGAPAPLEKRWRYYQSSPATPYKLRSVEPPKYVVLDDLAAFEITQSNIPHTTFSRLWSHDFAGPGKVRSRRPNRGRPAVGDQSQPVDAKLRYRSVVHGQRGLLYYFRGSPAWEPIHYAGLEEALTIPLPLHKQLVERTDPKQHNQHTPKQELVRNGAPSRSLTRGKYRERLSAFLRRSPSPPAIRSRTNFPGTSGTTKPGTRFVAETPRPYVRRSSPETDGSEEMQESLWVDQEQVSDVSMSLSHDTTANTEAEFQDSISSIISEEVNLNSVTNEARGLKRASFATDDYITNKRIAQELGDFERLATGLRKRPVHDEAAKSYRASRVRDLEIEVQKTQELVSRGADQLLALRAELDSLKEDEVRANGV